MSDTKMGRRASPGIVTGPAMVLGKPTEVSRLTPGCIMVVRDTDPEWIPAFEFLSVNGGGILTEIGGMLCHAAVVSREMKIPCVTGLAGAMTYASKVSTITLNGSTGEVKFGA